MHVAFSCSFLQSLEVASGVLFLRYYSVFPTFTHYFLFSLFFRSSHREQADAKRIYREMYILRHLRHNEIIHLRDVLMPAAFHDFRDLYLVRWMKNKPAPVQPRQQFLPLVGWG